jgi:hypothetical protein
MWRAALVLCASALFGATAPVSITDRSTGMGATFGPDGEYVISTGIADWKFGGSLGQPPTAIVDPAQISEAKSKRSRKF